jgi:hypothetical protein
MLGYEITIQRLYDHGLVRLQDRVDSARLVFPAGSVPQAGLLWIELGLNGQDEKKLVAVPVASFHDYVKLPLVATGGHEEPRARLPHDASTGQDLS